MSLTDDDRTPNPDALPTPAEFARRFTSLEREFRELRRAFEHHRGVDFDELEDRVDLHEAKIGDLKQLIISHQTTNGLILQSIDRRMESMVVLIRELRPVKTETTAITAVPHE